MAKLCKPILEYKEIIKSTGITPNDYSPPKKTIQRFLRLFKQISDQRVEGMIVIPFPKSFLLPFSPYFATLQPGSRLKNLVMKRRSGSESF